MGAFEKLVALRAAADRKAPLAPKETPMDNLQLADRIVRAAIERAEARAKAKGKSWRGAHVVIDNVNATLKEAGFATACPKHGRADACEVGARLVATGAFEIAPARYGARIYLAGTRPVANGDREVAAILAAAGAPPATAAPTPVPVVRAVPKNGDGAARPRPVTVTPDDVV